MLFTSNAKWEIFFSLGLGGGGTTTWVLALLIVYAWEP